MKKIDRKFIESSSFRLDLPTAIYNEIKEIADKENKSRTYTMIEALQEFIEKKGETNE
ncbi:hypothetical protein DelCs14_2853 [Delftia sp. Cs1-4]|uniref:hypothetical protein n=1 Tax=unclassified Delftia TaxID=2613839 RepID=UPI00020E84E2|nr:MULTISPECIES: hypothetical protein [unclassified Delftia]AEF89865.1 hypothetical protein DelCs14_2853 [Delftia sp. Cs1-4]